MPGVFYCGFSGPIDPSSAQRIAAAFNHALNQGFSEVYLCLSSNGGTVADGLYLHNHIRGLPIRTTIHNTGIIASIAATIYVAADNRVCSKYAAFLLHPTSVPTTTNMAAEPLHEALTAAVSLDESTDNILRDRVAIPQDVLERRRYGEVFITPENAIKFGIAHLIDEVSFPDGIQVSQL